MTILQSIAYRKLDVELKTRFKELLCHAYDDENGNKRLQAILWTGGKNSHTNNADYSYYMIKDGDNIADYTMMIPVKMFIMDET